MPGRKRRVRVLALIAFVGVAFVLYTRPSGTIGGAGRIAEELSEYGEKARVGGGGELVGGGAVLRQKAEGGKAAGLGAVGVGPTSTRREAASSGWLGLSQLEQTLSSISVSSPAPPHALKPAPSRLEGDDHSTTSAIHWTKSAEKFPISTTIQLPTGSPKPIPHIQVRKKDGDEGADEARLAIIKAATQHAWEGYRSRAWPHDELRPISGTFKDTFNGWGATLVDTLDTLWIMNMTAEFEEAVAQVSHIDFTTSPRPDIPLFETTIRYLGGLVAAYDIAESPTTGKKYTILLDKAVELAELLYAAFDTPNRIPEPGYYWRPVFASNAHRSSTRAVLAEIGSLSLEFTRLAQLTGEPKYYDAVARITNAFDEWQDHTRLPGMWPTLVDASGCRNPAQMQTRDAVTGTDGPFRPANHEAASLASGTGPVKIDEKVLTAAEAESNARKRVQEAQRKLDAGEMKEMDDNVAKGRPGVDRTQDFTGPRVEGTLDSPQAKDKLLNDRAPQEASKRKRQLDTAFQSSAEAIRDRAAINVEAVTAQRKVVHSRAMPNAVPTELTGAETCIPQGLGSPSELATETFTLGGLSDSAYEYLPKVHLLLAGRDTSRADQYRDMYVKFADVAIEKLVFRPMTVDNRDILISGSLKVAPGVTDGSKIETFEPDSAHLTCFAGGMFAMGGVIFDRPEDVEVGAKITDGCVWAYEVTATGIMPEQFWALPCKSKRECEWDEGKYWAALDPRATQTVDKQARNLGPGVGEGLTKRQLGEGAYEQAKPPQPAPGNKALARDTSPLRAASNENKADQFQHAPAQPIWTPPPPLSHEEYVKKKMLDERLPPGFVRLTSRNYILRPEAIESVFYLYRITGNQHWREVGWRMFNAIQDATSSEHGNSAIDDVTKAAPAALDSMESFWLAETLKYFWLLFDDPDRWSLDDWVLNTEAHFFRRDS